MAPLRARVRLEPLLPLLLLALLLFVCRVPLVCGASAGPAMGWHHAVSTVLGQEPEGVDAEDNPTGVAGVHLPAGRCSHTLTQISATLADAIYPNYEPTWFDGDGGDGFVYSIALMVGGRSEGSTTPDSWLVQLASSNASSWADWVPLADSENAPPEELASRAGLVIHFLPARDQLLAYGGQDGWSNQMADAWTFSVAAPTWELVSFAGDVASRPIGRSLSHGGLVRVPGSGAGGGDGLVMFGGETNGALPLDDMWTLNVPADPADPTPFAWSKPENLPCLHIETVCPDALPFASLFPDLDATTAPLLDEYYYAASELRPSQTLESLQRLKSLVDELSGTLQTPEMVDYADHHPTDDAQCADVCVQDDAATAPAPRPSARIGHGLSLWDWTDPRTGERVLKLVLWGGSACDSDEQCYDTDLHFLDLQTWEWSVVRRPDQAPGAGPESHWPTRRAFHTQHVYTTETSAELWVFGGSYQERGNLHYHNDVAVFDLVEQRWYLTPLDRHAAPAPGFIDMYGGMWANGVLTSAEMRAQHASLLVGDQIWLHSGCMADQVPIWDTALWVMRLGARITPDMIRLTNDAPDWIFGQGLSHAHPGDLYDVHGNVWRFNYFFFETAENVGTVQTWSNDSEIAHINDALIGIPTTNSTALPYWGHFLPWGTGLNNRFSCLLVSNFVPGGRRNSSRRSTIVTTTFNPGYPQELGVDGLYLGEYSITTGSKYDLYVTLDNQDVPGSPFHLSLEPDQASARNSVPADHNRTVPPFKINPETGEPLQTIYGNSMIPRPVTGNGLGLVQALRGSTASFQVQIVDTYLNEWVDDSGLETCMTNEDPDLPPMCTFRPLDISMQLVNGVGVAQRNMTLDEYNYVSNGDGTYTVTYRVPDVDSFALVVLIKNQRIAQGEVIVVKGVEPLELSELQMIGMLTVSSIISALMLASFVFFLVTHYTAQMQSRSLLFDALFTLGTVLGTLAIVEQTNYSGGYSIGEDLHPYISTHNACQLHSVFIGIAVVLCFGSVYAQVERSRLIYLACRKSAAALSNPEGKKSSAITLNQELPATGGNPNAPLPLIPNMPTDVQILLPVLALLLLECVFQAVWAGVAPMAPALAVADDGFRTYVECSGSSKQTWVYISIAMKGVMCAWFLFWSSGGRSVTDAMGESRMLAWSTYNMAFTTAVATLLVFLLDAADSIKTSFIVSAFAVCWSCLLCLALVYLPRVRAILRAHVALDPYWYDAFIQGVQEEELQAKARAEKEERDFKGGVSQMGNASSLGVSSLGNVSSLGSNSSGGGSHAPAGAAASGSLRTLRTNTIGGAGGRSAAASLASPTGAGAGAKKPTPVTRAIPKPLTAHARSGSAARLSTGSVSSSGPSTPSAAPPTPLAMATSMPASSQLVDSADHEAQWRA